MRILWLLLGLLSFSIGVIGIFVPLLPTVPLIILAAYFFSKSSERFHNWLLTHHIFGPFIDNWRTNGSISRRAKIYSTILIMAVFGVSLFLGLKLLILIIQFVVLGSVLTFIWTRPTA